MQSIVKGRLGPEGLTVEESPFQSLAEAVHDEPFDGVYTVDRTYPGGRVLRLDRHLDRLEDSAAREGMPIRVDRDAVRAALRRLLAIGSFESVRFRISVARSRPDELRFSLEPFTPMAPEVLERGVRCVSTPERRRLHPETKTLDWMHGRAEAPLPPGIFEALLLGPGGVVLEGTSSNFYGVTAEGDTHAGDAGNGEARDRNARDATPRNKKADDGNARLNTHRLRTAEHGVLHGIARSIVLEIAPALLPVRLEPVTIAEVTTKQAEAFLTSSTRGIIPVVEIDGMTVGPGLRGPWTKQLQDAYAAWVEAHLQPL